MYDYFYGAESEQFSFYRIPKVLFTEERFKAISAEAKVLYGLLLDRMSLSAKNGWQDKENRVYISSASMITGSRSQSSVLTASFRWRSRLKRL